MSSFRLYHDEESVLINILIDYLRKTISFCNPWFVSFMHQVEAFRRTARAFCLLETQTKIQAIAILLQ